MIIFLTNDALAGVMLIGGEQRFYGGGILTSMRVSVLIRSDVIN